MFRATIAIAGFCGLLSACSSGQLGVSGQVRFSQVVSFAETTDFGPPIVTSSGLLIQLEYPTLGAEQVDPSLTLVVADRGGSGPSGHATVVPLGFAQYAIGLTASGNYTLVAEKDGKSVASLPVSAAGAGGLHWHDPATVTVTGTANGKTCGSTSSVPLAQLVLAPNSSITLTVVPDDGKGNALLGMLQLSASADGPAQLSSGFLGQGLTPNTLTVAPQGSLGTAIHLTAADAVTGKSLTLDIPTQAANAAVTCSN